MKTPFILIAFIFLASLFSPPSFADRGAFWLREDAVLSQNSQKAIILHNRKEEVLILGTELRANKDTGVLEFIPLPSEPQVSLAQGNPFEVVNELLARKGIEFMERRAIARGKGEGVEEEAVEIILSQKIGLHNVTVIKINDIEGFNKWVLDFLAQKGFQKTNTQALRNLSAIAEDYLKREIQYFVFDYVEVGSEVRFVEPLIYRFKTDKLYYPLKTSNTIGGRGRIELVLILPGTLGINQDERAKIENLFPKVHGLLGRDAEEEIFRPFFERQGLLWSTSSKVYLKELKPIYEKVEEIFPPGSKIYLQMLRYTGPYDFKDDLNIDISKIAPYARKRLLSLETLRKNLKKLTPVEIEDILSDFYTSEEIDDYFQAHGIRRSSPIVQFVASWGKRGSGEGEFYYPRGIAIDSKGYVYVIDRNNNRIQKFTSDGKFVAKWGKEGRENGEFENPIGIAVDSKGFVYVIDEGNNSVQKFTPDGKFVAKWGRQGLGKGEFYAPTGIAVDSKGYVYVVDWGFYGNASVQKFTSDGKFVAEWGRQGFGKGDLYTPMGIAVDSKGYVYVVDLGIDGNASVQKFTSDGRFVAKWPIRSEGVAIAVDQKGFVYVAGGNRIRKFSPTGRLVGIWGRSGTGEGEFDGPSGIAVDRKGYIYVVDGSNHRIQKFKRAEKE